LHVACVRPPVLASYSDQLHMAAPSVDLAG